LIVIDASVLTDVLLGREQSLQELGREQRGHEHEPLHAPEVVEPETLNALRKLALRGRVTTRRATEAVADLANLRLVRYPHEPLRARMWELRDGLTAYDAAYVALAEALGDGLLLTADQDQAAAATQVLGSGSVRLVG
jgi:predicted nucleic acid-binding protein